jgi:glycerophosphoryl diester phosphodiesterase
LTWVIAHRGASAYEAENSLAAFRAAIRLGADGVELDVHVTKDGATVVHHDPSAGSFPIAETRFRELRAHKLPNGERSLLDVLDAGPAPNHYHVHSFDHRIVKRLKTDRPSLPCGVLSTSYPVDPLAQMHDAGATELWQVQDMLDSQLIDAVHRAGHRIYTWTVDEPDLMRELIGLGVDAICTNRPDVAREILQ